MPGIIDSHAHFSYDALDVNAQRNPSYYANLAYGVTSAHDISAPTQAVFTQSEMVKAGIIGCRIQLR